MSRIADVDREAWNRLALPLQTPLLEWEWLELMERSGAISAGEGWHPHHLTVWSGGRLIAAAPLYIKEHSEGEFVFDQIWAEVAGYLDIAYYPKLVGMSPVTPISGYRFLMAADQNPLELMQLMLTEIEAACQRQGLSGFSLLFIDSHWPQWQAIRDARRLVTWVHQGFEWRNEHFQSFDDYLARFNANQRRNVRRERKRLTDMGIEIRALSGDEITTRDLDLMYRFYLKTNRQFGPWACLYLNRSFFEGLLASCRRRLLLMVARYRHDPASPVGMSMLLRKGGILLGRYWGGDDRIPFLHFNLCYYSPIEWAIARGIRRFDPGMGGHHKVRRGFVSTRTFSLHRFVDPRMNAALEHFIGKVNQEELARIRSLNEAIPFIRPE